MTGTGYLFCPRCGYRGAAGRCYCTPAAEKWIVAFVVLAIYLAIWWYL